MITSCYRLHLVNYVPGLLKVPSHLCNESSSVFGEDVSLTVSGECEVETEGGLPVQVGPGHTIRIALSFYNHLLNVSNTGHL